VQLCALWLARPGWVHNIPPPPHDNEQMPAADLPKVETYSWALEGVMEDDGKPKDTALSDQWQVGNVDRVYLVPQANERLVDFFMQLVGIEGLLDPLWGQDHSMEWNKPAHRIKVDEWVEGDAEGEYVQKVHVGDNALSLWEVY
jgi:hypothetical protein